MSRWLASLTIVAALAAPCMAAAQTIDDALEAAFRNNPDLEEARLALRAAAEDRVQARAAYLPSLGVSGSYGAQSVEVESMGFFGPQTTETDLDPATAGVQVRQDLYTGGRRRGVDRLANAGVEGARHGLRAAEQDVLLATVDAYLSVRRDQEILRLSEEHVAGLERQVNGTRRRLEVGEVSRTDLSQAETRLAGARASLARAQANLAASMARYVAVVGEAPQRLAPVVAPETPNSLDEAVSRAESLHPDLLQARSGADAARARVTIDRSAMLPQVSLVGRYDESEDVNSVGERREGVSAITQFSWALFEGGLARSRFRQSRINVLRAEARIEAERRQVVADVVSAWNDLAAGSAILNAAREQVAASEEALRGAERERGLGLRSTIDVLNAEEERRNALIALARAEADSTFAAYALLAASGALSLDSLGLRD